jgi:hypothetical protein
MKAYTCELKKTTGGGATVWSPLKPNEFVIGDEVTFGSPDGVWSVRFDDSPFDLAPVSRDFGGEPKKTESVVILREGLFDCGCALNVDGKAVLDWNGPGGKGDQMKTVPPGN